MLVGVFQSIWKIVKVGIISPNRGKIFEKQPPTVPETNSKTPLKLEGWWKIIETYLRNNHQVKVVMSTCYHLCLQRFRHAKLLKLGSSGRFGSHVPTPQKLLSSGEETKAGGDWPGGKNVSKPWNMRCEFHPECGANSARRFKKKASKLQVKHFSGGFCWNLTFWDIPHRCVHQTYKGSQKLSRSLVVPCRSIWRDQTFSSPKDPCALVIKFHFFYFTKWAEVLGINTCFNPFSIAYCMS